MPNKTEIKKYIAGRVEDAIKSVAQYSPKTEGFDTAITDALTNLRHLCDAKGLDFAKLDQIAYRHYSAEVLGQDAF